MGRIRSKLLVVNSYSNCKPCAYLFSTVYFKENFLPKRTTGPKRTGCYGLYEPNALHNASYVNVLYLYVPCSYRCILDFQNNPKHLTAVRVGKDYAIKLIKLADGQSAGEGSRFIQLQLSSRNPIEGSAQYPEAENQQGANSENSDDQKPNNTLLIVLIIVGGAIILLGGGALGFIAFKKNKKISEATE